MSTQLIGFSIGGVARRFLVAPPSMSTFALFPSLSSALTLNLPSMAKFPRHMRPLQHPPFPDVPRDGQQYKWGSE